MDNQEEKYEHIAQNRDSIICNVDERDVEMTLPEPEDESEWDVDNSKICFCFNRDACYNEAGVLVGKSLAMVCSIIVVVIIIVAVR